MANFTPGVTFASQSGVVNKSLLDDTVANAVPLVGLTDNSTLNVATNKLQVKDLGIVAAKIAAGAVTPAKLGDFAYCWAQTSGASVSNASETNVAFANADDYDTKAMHDPASDNHKFVVKQDGYYVVMAQFRFASTIDTGFRRILLCHYRSGLTYLDGDVKPGVSGAQVFLKCCATRYMLTNDYVYLSCYRNNGGSDTIDYASMQIHQIG